MKTKGEAGFRVFKKESFLEPPGQALWVSCRLPQVGGTGGPLQREKQRLGDTWPCGRRPGLLVGNPGFGPRSLWLQRQHLSCGPWLT